MTTARERTPETIAKQLAVPCPVCTAVVGEACRKSYSGVDEGGAPIWVPKADAAPRRLPHSARGL